MTGNIPAPHKDFEVTPGPPDGISDLAFSPVADYLAASSWDGQSRVWEVQPSGATVAKAAIPHDAPPLCVSFSKDGTKLFSGGCDKAGKLMDLNTGQIMQVAGHDAPIRCARWINHGNMNDIVVTGSWDKSLRYWDLRSPTPAAVVPLTERVYTMDVNSALLVLGTADRKISMFNVQNPTQVYREVESPLKFQTRVVSCFINAKGFAVGSIEGRVGIQYVEAADQHLNFSFKCHRDDRNVYSVNAISFHPLHGTFATAGADGGFNFWDKDSKQRLKQWESCGQTISCSTFNRTGNIYAYAASYDWSKGVEGRQPNSKDAIFLHAVKDEDIKPRVAKPTTKR